MMLSSKRKGARERSHAPSQSECTLRIRAAGHGGDTATVLRPAGLAGLGADRAFLAVGHGFDAAGRHALADQDFLHGVGATRAQRQVVLTRAALVAMTFDGDADRRILLQPGGLAAQ